MDDRLVALASGTLATAVMVLVLYAIDAGSAYQFLAYESLASLFGTSATIGLVLFVSSGVVVWPLVFLVIGQHLAPDSEVVRGIVLTELLWISFLLAFIPIADVWNTLYFVVASVISHLVYGAVLGFAFGRFGGSHQDVRRYWPG